MTARYLEAAQGPAQLEAYVRECAALLGLRSRGEADAKVRGLGVFALACLHCGGSLCAEYCGSAGWHWGPEAAANSSGRVYQQHELITQQCMHAICASVRQGS